MSLIKRNGGLTPLNKIFSDFFDTEKLFDADFLRNIPQINVPAANVKEEDKKFLVELAAPGFSRKDFKINIENNILIISAEKEEEKKEEKKNYTKREFNYNSFERSFTLPDSVNSDSINAEYKDGILNLTLPKKADAINKARKEITVS